LASLHRFRGRALCQGGDRLKSVWGWPFSMAWQAEWVLRPSASGRRCDGFQEGRQMPSHGQASSSSARAGCQRFVSRGEVLRRREASTHRWPSGLRRSRGNGWNVSLPRVPESPSPRVPESPSPRVPESPSRRIAGLWCLPSSEYSGFTTCCPGSNPASNTPWPRSSTRHS
jgi:hypothetical protein